MKPGCPGALGLDRHHIPPELGLALLSYGGSYTVFGPMADSM